MYRVLVVDNEPIIVDGLVDLFAEAEDLDLEIFKAESAQEALVLLQENAMDVVFADIHMPGMDGLELQRRIAERWPRCRVIFLTGFNDFEYVQTALRNGGADYILKTESDDRILEALRSALDGLRSFDEQHRYLSDAKRSMEMALPLLQRERIVSLLDGEIAAEQSGLDELGTTLRADSAVLLIVGRIDEGWTSFSASDRMLLMYAAHNIAQEYCSDSVIFHILYDHTKFVWMSQPKNDKAQEEAWSGVLNPLHEKLDSIQTTCRGLLKLSLSFAAASAPCPWNEVPVVFSRLTDLLRGGLGLGKEALLTDDSASLLPRSKTSDAFRLQRGHLNLLEQYLESGDGERFADLCRTVLQGATPDYLSYAEAYYGVLSVVLGFAKRLNPDKESVNRLDLEELMRIDLQPTWEAAAVRFETAASRLAMERRTEQDENTHFLIERLHQHIRESLDQDLSLNRLSEVVHLNPSYLSRLYKQIEGRGLTEYIANRRIERAMELLARTPLKIHEIAVRVGLESGYFIKLFKRTSKMTPQEFREKHQRSFSD